MFVRSAAAARSDRTRCGPPPAADPASSRAIVPVAAAPAGPAPASGRLRRDAGLLAQLAAHALDMDWTRTRRRADPRAAAAAYRAASALGPRVPNRDVAAA